MAHPAHDLPFLEVLLAMHASAGRKKTEHYCRWLQQPLPQQHIKYFVRSSVGVQSSAAAVGTHILVSKMQEGRSS
jgi:hypothetical protein